MKRGIILSILLVAVLLMSTAFIGCDKATGGGSFYDEATGDLITFGFNAQPVGDPYLAEVGSPYYIPGEETWIQDAKGNLSLVDHNKTAKVKIKVNFSVTIPEPSEYGLSAFGGNCTINGDGPYYFGAVFTDVGEGYSGDYIQIGWNDFATLDDLLGSYSGYLNEGSDIVVHSK
jgi:hypothetical protein